MSNKEERPSAGKLPRTNRDDRSNSWWHEMHPESRIAGPGTDTRGWVHDGRTNLQRENDIIRHRFWMDYGRDLGMLP